jgi:hypothetical protein
VRRELSAPALSWEVRSAYQQRTLWITGQFTRERQVLRFAIDRLPPGISGRGTFFTPYLCAQIVLEIDEALTVGAQIVKAEEGVRASPPN